MPSDVPYTCPDIDHMIRLLEDLRTSNSALRDWGETLEEEKLNLNVEIDNLNNDIYDLQKELKKAYKTIENLKDDQSTLDDQIHKDAKTIESLEDKIDELTNALNNNGQ